jgi:quercetin dioxygenase-like cupin family protein
MKIAEAIAVEARPVTMEGSKDCMVRWLIGKEDGAENFAMRQFVVEPGGYTPRHSHPYEHEIFVLEGTGVAVEGDRAHAVKAGDVIFVPSEEIHQFRNTGSAPLKFLCLIPHVPPGTPVRLAPECQG